MFKAKILVVDDEEDILNMLSGSLEDEGYEVWTAGDGAEAVKAAEAAMHDIILMDWYMPSMSGIEALRAIREKGIDSPVVMVTTESEKGRIIEALNAGADEYVIKPFKMDVLVARIREVLENRAKQAAPAG